MFLCSGVQRKRRGEWKQDEKRSDPSFSVLFFFAAIDFIQRFPIKAASGKQHTPVAATFLAWMCNIQSLRGFDGSQTALFL